MPERSYSAFISYRHADNRDEGRRWAEWLHQALETYEVPRDLIGKPNARGATIPASLYPVFRDEAELPANAELSAPIRAALENSATLLVLCSPRAVESRFVADEIRTFKELGKADRIFALILDGEPNADDPGKVAAGLDPRLECFPEPLRFGVLRPGHDAEPPTVDWTIRAEPIAADVRPGGLPVQGYTSAVAYRSALEKSGQHTGSELRRLEKEYASRIELARLKIVSGIVGVPLGVLKNRDAEHRARKFRRLASVFGALTLLAMIAGAFALWQGTVAQRQRQLAENQRQRAEQESEQRGQLLEEAARSDRLAAQERLDHGKETEALAYLARALKYRPASSHPAEAAMPIITGPAQFARTVFRGHSQRVSCVAFSPDGERIVSASGDSTARVWDVPRGRPLSVLEAHSKGIRSAIFSPDGHYILTASWDETARLWDAQTGKALVEYRGHASFVNAAVFSLDGTRVLTASDDGTARIWEALTGKMQLELKGHSKSVATAVFSSDGRLVATGSSDQTARIWDAETGQLRAELKGHNSAVESVAFSPGHGQVLTAEQHTGNTRDETRTWDAHTGESLADFGGEYGSFSPDGGHVLTSRGVWEAKTGKLILDLADEAHPIDRARFSPDGLRILTTRHDLPPQLLDARTGEVLAEYHGHTVPKYSNDNLLNVTAIFSPDGRHVLTGGEDYTVRCWDAESGRGLVELKGHFLQYLIKGDTLDFSNIKSAVFNADGRRVLTGSADYTARLWDTFSGQLLTIFRGHEISVLDAVVSPDGRQVVSGGLDKTARLWDTASGKLQRTFKTRSDCVDRTVFSSDGRRLLIVPDSFQPDSPESPPQLCDAQTGQVIAEVQGWVPKWEAVFSPDSRLLVTSGDPPRIWDAETGRQLTELKGHPNILGPATFSPDSRHVITGDSDGTARLWDAQTGTKLIEFKGHSARVLTVSFSPDGRCVLTGAEDKTARVWDAETGRQLALLAGHEDNLVHVAIFSPDGRRILTLGGNGIARFWDARSGQPLRVITPRGRGIDVARFSPDGRRALTTSGDTARLWDLLPADQPPPEWFPEFLTALGGQRLGVDGRLEDLPVDSRFVWSPQLAEIASQSGDSDYLRLLRWKMTPAPKRTLSPFSETTRAAAAEAILWRAAEPPAVAHAYTLDPAHPLVHLALATFEKEEIAADFLRRYSLDRLPDEAALQLRAGELLAEQKQPQWALGYIERGLWHLRDAAKAQALGGQAAGMQKKAAELRARLRKELELEP